MSSYINKFIYVPKYSVADDLLQQTIKDESYFNQHLSRIFTICQDLDNKIEDARARGAKRIILPKDLTEIECRYIILVYMKGGYYVNAEKDQTFLFW